jgi:preprotein translocase subunit SecA
MYSKLGGMTGTADTEAGEFKSIYNLDVVVIPTHVPVQRQDLADRVYMSEREKLKAVVEDIIDTHKTGQPILVGTISVEKSEQLSAMLTRHHIRHNVLNAKNHAREADIIAEAGRVGAVTIATNMAGRGTDIKLGGDKRADYLYEELINDEDTPEEVHPLLQQFKEKIDKMKLEEAKADIEKMSGAVKKGASEILQSVYDWIEEHEEVKKIGGLYILGTERHESRRIDNQLRGRSGRQGDPGRSRFYISLEDNLMRLFGGERIQGMLSKLGMEEGENIEHKWITGAIEKAQKKVEMRNFEIRKHLLDYDDVMNTQRNYIYKKRDELLVDKNIIERVYQSSCEYSDSFADDYFGNIKHLGKEAFTVLLKDLKETFFLDLNLQLRDHLSAPDALKKALADILKEELDQKDKVLDHDYLNGKLKELYLYLIDKLWQSHIENMEQLREAVYLRSYSQKNPLVEYKIEGSNMFDALIDTISSRVINQIFRIKIETVSAPQTSESSYTMAHDTYSTFSGNMKQAANANRGTTIVNSAKIGRNELCPCGSGKKYKKCCGQNA